MNTALFTLKNLDVKIGNKKILSIPELAINSHKITAIIGPNGAGKSTLLKALIGHIRVKNSLAWGSLHKNY